MPQLRSGLDTGLLGFLYAGVEVLVVLVLLSAFAKRSGRAAAGIL